MTPTRVDPWSRKVMLEVQIMFNHDVERKIVAILHLLSQTRDPLGARELSRRLTDEGVFLTERAVRYHLKILDERGLTCSNGPNGREGRLITDKGRDELSNALVSDKVGLISTKIEALAFAMDFDPAVRGGRILLNTSLLPTASFPAAVEAMREVFKSKLCVSDLVAVKREGELIGDTVVPRGYTGFGTMCSITVNGLLLKAGIPVESRFGGILQTLNGQPLRFTELIAYSGSSLDPMELFIRAKMTGVQDSARSGNGKTLASFREIPAVCQPRAEEIFSGLAEAGIRGLIRFGEPSQEVCAVPVTRGRVGMIIIGGLNPIAAMAEAGTGIEYSAMSTLAEFSSLQSFWSLC